MSFNNVTSIEEFKKRRLKFITEELSAEEEVLCDGVTLEYLCNKYYSVSTHEVSVNSESMIFAVADVGDIGGDGDCWAALMLKSNTLYSSGLYYPFDMVEIEYAGFFDDKQIIAHEIVDWISHFYPDDVVTIEN